MRLATMRVLLLKNFYFVPFFKSSAETSHMPAVIYTQPELASIGLIETAARAKYSDIRTVHFDFDENDRAIAEGATKGGVKLVARKNGTILGASIVGEGAGDLIQMVGIVMANKLKIIAFTKMISPYLAAARLCAAPRALGIRTRYLAQNHKN